MIKINGTEIQNNKFPDGSSLLKLAIHDKNVLLEWLFEDNSELWLLIAITRHLRRGGHEKIALYLPYCPNARQDRVKVSFDVFTLKYFAEVINSLNFDYVEVVDAHSSVTPALIDRCINTFPELPLAQAISQSKANVLFFPDEGAMKRYSQQAGMPYLFGVKSRDWETGEIKNIHIIGEIQHTPFNILIVDDICSKGRTFYESALKLKELGANEISLYITHCENSIHYGEFGEKKQSLLDCGLITSVFTTKSILTKEHPMIHVLGGKENVED